MALALGASRGSQAQVTRNTLQSANKNGSSYEEEATKQSQVLDSDKVQEKEQQEA